MKKKIVALSLGLGLALSVFSFNKISAVTTDSDATVTFTPNLSAVDPVDPLNPDIPGVGPGTGMTGPLTIDYVPDLPFGSHEITGGVQVLETTNNTPYVQVTDKSGTGAGWRVKASLSDFEDTVDGSSTIAGAKIDFNNSAVTKPTTNLATAPTASDFTITSGAAAVDVMSADVDNGMGTWLNTWLSSDTGAGTNENVTLSINSSSAYAKAYAALVTWSLEVTP